jgi:hypothetical protein
MERGKSFLERDCAPLGLPVKVRGRKGDFKSLSISLCERER